MAEIERTELTLRLDATVTVYDATGTPTDWLKPGTEMSTSWRGVPGDEEIVLSYRKMTEITKLTLEDTIVAIRGRLMEVQRGRNG